MANIEKRGDSYRITVSNGYDSNGKQIIFRSTFKPAPNLSKKEIEKQVKEYAASLNKNANTAIMHRLSRLRSL